MDVGVTPPGVEMPDPNEFCGQAVVPISVTCMVLSTVFVGLRFYARARIIKALGKEDGFILVSLVCAVTMTSTGLGQLSVGLGRHFNHPSVDIEIFLKISLAVSLFYSLSLTFTKVSILFLYIRSLTLGWCRLLSKLLLAIVAITHAWIIVSVLTSCVPLEAFWTFDRGPGVFCQDMAVYLGDAGLNMVTDFMIFLVPIPVIWNLRVGRRQKAFLLGVFLLAFCVCVLSLVRLISFLESQKRAPGVTDVTWNAVLMANWTNVEVHAAIITACLPVLKPLIVRVWPRALGHRTDNLPSEMGNSDTPPLTVGTGRTRHLNSHEEKAVGEPSDLEVPTLAEVQGPDEPQKLGATQSDKSFQRCRDVGSMA